MYKVIKFFSDLQDKGHKYKVGDVYPRHGLTINEDRVKELSTTNNKRGMIFIEEVAEEVEKPKKKEKKNAKRTL